jgi:hypothetical protein
MIKPVESFRDRHDLAPDERLWAHVDDDGSIEFYAFATIHRTTRHLETICCEEINVPPWDYREEPIKKKGRYTKTLKGAK